MRNDISVFHILFNIQGVSKIVVGLLLLVMY